MNFITSLIEISLFAPISIALLGLIPIMATRTLWYMTTGLFWFLSVSFLSATLYVFWNPAVFANIEIWSLEQQWLQSMNFHFSLYIEKLTLVILTIASIGYLLVLMLSRSALCENKYRMISFVSIFSALTGCYASGNLLQMCFFSMTLIVPCSLLIGADESAGCKETVRRYIISQSVAAFVILFCAISIQLWAQGDGQTPIDNSYSTVVVGILMFSLLIRTCIFPFYSIYTDISKHKDVLILLPVFTFGNIGFWAIFKFVVPVFSSELLMLNNWLLAWGCFAGLWPLLFLFSGGSERANIPLYASLSSGPILLGLISGDAKGLYGAVGLWLFSQFCLIAFLVLAKINENQGISLKWSQLKRKPIVSVFAILTMASLFSTPFSLGFSCLMLIIWGYVETGGVLISSILSIIVPISPLVIYLSLFREAKSEAPMESKTVRDSYRVEIFAMCVVFISLAGLSVYPEFLIRLIQPTISGLSHLN